ncbi:ATP-binding protein [Kitasatospora sp. NPDC058965]|uniref:ATP-binding protein n=1 Tax=Kitasatospora sp. NPDC058965 TaxID=3346682 RepID=UPI0036BB98F6
MTQHTHSTRAHPTGAGTAPRHAAIAAPEPATDNTLEGLAQAAIEKDLRLAWFTLETLPAAIGKSKVDSSTARTAARICRAVLLVIDDIGLLPVGEDTAEAFYRIIDIDAAYERRWIAMASNIHPSKAHVCRRTCARCCRDLTGSMVPRRLPSRLDVRARRS